MRKNMGHLIVFWSIFAILVAPGTLFASDPMVSDPDLKPGEMTADALLARPLGLASLVVGFGVFVVSSPFSLMGGNADKAWKALVVTPAQFTFARPLGEFEQSQMP